MRSLNNRRRLATEQVAKLVQNAPQFMGKLAAVGNGGTKVGTN